MNHQSSTSTRSDTSRKEAASQLKFMDELTQRLRRTALWWVGGTLTGYIASSSLSDPASSLLYHASLACMCVSLVYVGRWVQGLNTMAWLRARDEDGPEIDWSEIPESGAASEVRSFASVEEATERGWKAGPAVAMFNGAPVPEWMECNGKRYAFDGLTGSPNMGFVPENLRLFGRLRFLAPSKADESAPVSVAAKKETDAQGSSPSSLDSASA